MQRDVSCIDCNDNESPINRGYSGSFIDIERTKLFSNFYYIDPRGIDLDFEKHQIDTIYVMRMVEG